MANCTEGYAGRHGRRRDVGCARWLGRGCAFVIILIPSIGRGIKRGDADSAGAHVRRYFELRDLERMAEVADLLVQRNADDTLAQCVKARQLRHEHPTPGGVAFGHCYLSKTPALTVRKHHRQRKIALDNTDRTLAYEVVPSHSLDGLVVVLGRRISELQPVEARE